jgi:hypothetical protein
MGAVQNADLTVNVGDMNDDDCPNPIVSQSKATCGQILQFALYHCSLVCNMQIVLGKVQICKAEYSSGKYENGVASGCEAPFHPLTLSAKVHFAH